MDRRNFLKKTVLSFVALASSSCMSDDKLSLYDKLSPMSSELHKVKPFTKNLTKKDFNTQEKVKRIVECHFL